MLNENIKRLRKEKGLTQKDLAVKVGVSITFISQIENGISKPSDENLKKIADVLGVTVNELEKEKSLSPIEELLNLLIELTEKEIIKWEVTVYERDDTDIRTTINDVNYTFNFKPYCNTKSQSNFLYVNDSEYNPENETEYNLFKKLYETIMMFHNIDSKIYKSISDLKSLLNEEE
ncbi:helix-turn-helix transcriptional regulator [uncultured Anaerococcus sp.]|uniref:helix-turn-helix domain-containing protein n=1 Tax=uncultured Anaerococcus sp. TaxID=293428 RepID=UPI002888F9B6|nr:helix-turn-helix transcriptional regulator [uncultured Anaerococcus sp.]